MCSCWHNCNKMRLSRQSLVSDICSPTNQSIRNSFRIIVCQVGWLAYKGVVAESRIARYDARSCHRVRILFQKAAIDRLEKDKYFEICLSYSINTPVALSCGEFGFSNRWARECRWGNHLITISQSHAGALEEEAISLGSAPFDVNESSTQTIRSLQLIDRPCKKHCGC